jgi:N-acylneuraminate cytidylyltransferase
MNPWWSFYIDPEKIPRKMFPQTYEKRSQDLPKLYCPSGAIWIAKTDEFKKLKSFHTEKTQYHIMNWQSAIDIDDVEDLEMAKAIFEMSRKGNKKC